VDQFDVEILNALQSNSRISHEALGDKIGLSASACQRRIKKLKQEGIVAKEVAILDGTKLPGFITVIIDLVLEKGGEKVLNQFIAQLEQEPCVQQFYYTAGDVDFVVIVVAQNMQDYDELSRRLFMSNANIKKFTSKVVITSNKVSSNILLT